MLRPLTELAVTAMAASIDERKARLRALQRSRSRGQRDSPVLIVAWHMKSAGCRNGLARGRRCTKWLIREWARAFKQFTDKEPILAHVSSFGRGRFAAGE